MIEYGEYKTKDVEEDAFYSTKNVILREIGIDNVTLDVGCNNGYFGKFDKSNIYYGLDYSENLLNEARKTYKDVMLYDLNNLQELLWDIKFDQIIFGDVLEHVLYPDKVLNFFVNKYLKDNGKIIISLPNIANWQMRLNLLVGKFNYRDVGIMARTHLHFYTFKTGKELVSSLGLKIDKTLFGSNIFGFIISVFPFLKSFLATNIVLIIKK